MDKNIIIYFLIGIGTLLLILGIFYKKWNLYNKFKPRKAIGRFLKEILGENGMRIYLLIISFIFLSLGLYVTYISHIKPELPARYSKKTDNISLSKDGGMSLHSTIEKVNNSPYLDIKFDKVSFKNNFIENVPEFVWKINSLKILDLENNDIKDISLEKLKNSKLKKIILTGNPISTEKINEIEKIGIDVIFKKDTE